MMGGGGRARSHCGSAPPLVHCAPDSLTYAVPLCAVALPLFTTARPDCAPDSLTYSAPLFLKRRCDRTPGGYADGVNSGTSALFAALGALDLPPASEVTWAQKLKPLPRRPVCCFIKRLTSEIYNNYTGWCSNDFNVYG
jgi:hypothetical protein